MDAFQEALILGAYPPDTGIVEAASYRPGYMRYPLRVRVRLPDGTEASCVLKADALIGGIEREGWVLPVLERLGLPVPTVLAGPTVHPDYPNRGALIVLSEMPGEPLPWFGATLAEIDLTCRLHQEAIARLHGLTEPLLGEDIAHLLPHRTLSSELDEMLARGGPWLETNVFEKAIRRLRPVLEGIDAPLVFSNGDYNPLNFLHDGSRLTGWIDFTGACFEDPLVGLAKFVIWGFDAVGWGPGIQAGLVERHLYRRNLRRSDFASRLVLRCLWRLQRDTSVAGEQDAVYRRAILSVLTDALESL